MKKIFVLFISLAVLFSFTMIINAAETETTIETEEQLSIEEETDSAMDKFANSSLWVSIGGVLTAIVSLLFGAKIILDKLKSIIKLIKTKADKNAIETAFKELKEGTLQEIKIVSEDLTNKIIELEGQNERELKLIAFLINYSNNLNPHAKNTIMAEIGGLRTSTGDLHEFITDLEKEVNEAKKKEIKADTPLLDAIVKESCIMKHYKYLSGVLEALGFIFQYIIPIALFGLVLPYYHGTLSAGLTKTGYVAVMIVVFVVINKLTKRIEQRDKSFVRGILLSIFPIVLWCVLGVGVDFLKQFFLNLAHYWWISLIFIVIGRVFIIIEETLADMNRSE